MYSIKRHIEPVIERRAKNNKAIALTGPRQVGKYTWFRHIFSNVRQVTFDDIKEDIIKKILQTFLMLM